MAGVLRCLATSTHTVKYVHAFNICSLLCGLSLAYACIHGHVRRRSRVYVWKNREEREIVQVDDRGSRACVRALREGVGIDITTTRRRKEISLVVFNPIFIAPLLPPFPRWNDIVWSFIVIVRQHACKWFEDKSKVNANAGGWTFQSSLEKKKKKKVRFEKRMAFSVLVN